MTFTRVCNRCGFGFVPPSHEVQRHARRLLERVFGETSEAITAAGFTPAAAARRARFPAEVVEDLVARKKLIGSFALGRLLRACKVPAVTVTELVAAMVALEELPDDLAIWDPSELDVSPVELRVTTCVELANVLLYLQKKSGLPKLQLAIQSGIPRSQLYNLIDPERFALPRSREQLYAFLRTCSLGDQQTWYVLSQWDQLDRRRNAMATVPPDVVPDLPLTPAFHDELKDRPATEEAQAIVDGHLGEDIFHVWGHRVTSKQVAAGVLVGVATAIMIVLIATGVLDAMFAIGITGSSLLATLMYQIITQNRETSRT